ncbi:hypothetical protein NESM_000760400 [Novymonas esmeraldas]|uniref:Secreted protein n=1 Tax=Novymonas esmeraldas TaxID=1808958 RepID=A0AAW0EYZ8_9TRYP
MRTTSVVRGAATPATDTAAGALSLERWWLFAGLVWSPVVASAGPASCRNACAAALARTTAESSRYAGDSRAWVSRHDQAQCLRHGGGEEERTLHHALWHAAWRPELLHEAAVFADAACA